MAGRIEARMRKLHAGIVLLAAGLFASPKPPTTRVILVGVDAGGDYLLDEFLTDGTLPADGGFAELVQRGVRAEASQPINIPMTAPSFATLFTGAYPERHGLVSNTYYRVTDPITQTQSSFEVPFTAEPIWEPVRRAGKRVVLVGSDIGTATPGLGPNLNFGYGESDGSSQLVELTPSAFASAEDWRYNRAEIEHARAARVVFATLRHGEHTAHLLVVDMRADGQQRYHRVVLDFDRDLTNGTAAELEPGQWAAVKLPVRAETTVGAWVKLMELAPDLSRLRLYISAPHHNAGSPPEFAAQVERALAEAGAGQGFWPGEGDGRALARGWIDEATFLEQLERVGKYLGDAALCVIAHEPFDLMIVYQPQADGAGHEFLLRHPRQAGYDDPALRARMAENLARGWRSVDRNLKALVRAAGPHTTFVLAADHGMIPVHTRVFPNRLLRQHGIVSQLPREPGNAPVQARAVTSGAQAHLYINLVGRQPGGVVSAEDYGKVVDRVVGLFTELRDPVTQEPVCAVVARREATRDYRILHEQTTGDVWLSLNPGYAFSGDDQPGEVFLQASRPEGQHGYLARFREMQTIFVAAGPGIRKAKLGVVANVDVAPTVARLLGVEPPRDAQGRVLEEILVGKK